MKFLRFFIIFSIIFLISGITIIYATDSGPGEGTAAMNPASVTAGSTGNAVVITYTAGATNDWSATTGTLAIVIPAGWSPASINNADPGYFTVNAINGNIVNSVTDGQTITITASSSGSSTTLQIIIIYGAGTGATASTNAGQAVFNIYSDPTDSSPIIMASTSPSINIIAPTETQTPTYTQTTTLTMTPTFTETPTPLNTPYGEGFAVIMPTQVTGGSSGNIIQIVYTAGETTWAAGTLIITIPTNSGWSQPSLINTAPGYYTVNISGGVLASTYPALVGNNWDIIVQVSSLAAHIGTITVSYGSTSAGGSGAMSQNVPGMALFVVSSQPNGSNAIPINDSPYLNVIIPTQTQTVTPSATVTPTATISIPQQQVFAFPNPVKIGQEIFFAYPVRNNILQNLKTVRILIYTVNGDKAYEVIDTAPDGYTRFDTSNMARGVYFYRITAEYTDGSTVKQDYHKFAVVK